MESRSEHKSKSWLMTDFSSHWTFNVSMSHPMSGLVWFWLKVNMEHFLDIFFMPFVLIQFVLLARKSFLTTLQRMGELDNEHIWKGNAVSAKRIESLTQVDLHKSCQASQRENSPLEMGSGNGISFMERIHCQLQKSNDQTYYEHIFNTSFTLVEEFRVMKSLKSYCKMHACVLDLCKINGMSNHRIEE